MASRTLLALALCASLPLAGCSAFRSYENELTQTSQHLASGDVPAALALLEKNNKSADKDLLYYFEKGELLRAQGDLQGSQETWRSADRTIIEWEDAIKADFSSNPNQRLYDLFLRHKRRA